MESRFLTIILKLLVIIFSIGIISCDCGYNYKFSVKNETSNSIFVVFYGGFRVKINDSILIKSGESEFLFSDDDYWPGGCPGPEREDIYYVLDSLKITTLDTISSQINYVNPDMWDYTPFAKGADFELTVRKSDFK